MLNTITRFYFECLRNPSCFKDLRRFVALLSVEEQKKFQATISEHAQSLGTKLERKEEDAPKEDIQVRCTTLSLT
jgi:N-terminal acetyltransferase B complex non-catalytic subunit